MTINLCFHGVGRPGRPLEDGEERYWIDESLFAATLDEVVGREDVRLSFDDGNRSDIEIGLPGLQARGLRATFFVLAGRLDQPGSLASSEVRELAAAGMAVGSHGMHHVPWRGLDQQAQEAEFGTSRQIISEVLGIPVREAALPLGRYDRTVLQALRVRGYEAVYSSDRAPARGSGQFLRPRYSLRATDTVEDVRRVLEGAGTVERAAAWARMSVKALRGTPGRRS